MDDIKAVLFCAALATLASVFAGVFLCLWVAYVTRTGRSPLPSLPKVSWFHKEKTVVADEKPRVRIGP